MVLANNEAGITFVDRLLSAFDRKTGEVVKDYKWVDFDLADFRIHFRVPDNDPSMYNQYQVSESDLEFIAKYLLEWRELDFQQFDYFVTCYESEGK